MVKSIQVDVHVIHPVDKRTMRKVHTAKVLGDALLSIVDTTGDEFLCLQLPGDGIKILHRDESLEPDPKLLAALANAVDDLQYMYDLMAYPMSSAAGGGIK